MAPEYCTRKFYDTQSDMFSLGMLIYTLYNHGRTLYQCHDNYSLLMRIADDLQALNSETLSTLPDEVREHVKMLLSLKSELRPDAEQFSKVTVFIDNAEAPSVLFFSSSSTDIGSLFPRRRYKNTGIPWFIISSRQSSTLDVLQRSATSNWHLTHGKVPQFSSSAWYPQEYNVLLASEFAAYCFSTWTGVH